MPGTASDIKFLLWLLLLARSSSCFASESDVQCLKTVQQSVVDPNGILKSSWNFDNDSSGSICRFTGVECWRSDENRILSLRLNNLGLQGRFPQGLEDCSSMVSLDLSSNSFSGPIPFDISGKVPYLSSLNLSYNSFSGQIPGSIAYMTYLNILQLQHNQLSGQIPQQLSMFTRLSVADNLLSGHIPSTISDFSVSSFSGNIELCDASLDSCKRTSDDESSIRMIGAAVGFILGFVVAFYFPHCFVFSKRLHPYIFRIC